MDIELKLKNDLNVELASFKNVDSDPFEIGDVVEIEDNNTSRKDVKLEELKKRIRLLPAGSSVFVHQYLCSLLAKTDDVGTVIGPDKTDTGLDGIEEEIGFWKTHVLIIKQIGSLKWLLQTDANRTYYFERGLNILSRPEIGLTKQVDVNLLSNEKVTNLDGLFPTNIPNATYSNFFPIAWWHSKGYAQNGKKEWVKKENIKPEPTQPKEDPKLKPIPKIEIGVLKGVPDYPKPDGLNTTDFDAFPDFEMPKNIKYIGGYGFPTYNNESLDKNGKLNLFKKGITNLINLTGYQRNKWADLDNGRWKTDKAHTFAAAGGLIKQAAMKMVAENKNNGIYGNIGIIASGNATDINYSGITVAGAVELGRYVYYTRAAYSSVDDPSFNIGVEPQVMLLDEETMNHSYSWDNGKSAIDLFGYITEGITAATGNKVTVLWYAQPIHMWIHYMIGQGVKIETITDVQLATLFTSGPRLSGGGWEKCNWSIDHNGGYAKVPFLSNTELYEKANSSYVLANGKRKFRTDDFEIPINGKNVKILSKPDPAIIRTGLQGVDPTYWQPESKMFVDGIYIRASGIISDLMMLHKLEYKTWSIQNHLQKYTMIGVHRPKTEPWTYLGNSTEKREVGDSEVFFINGLTLLAGGSGICWWEDGQDKNTLPNKGEKLYYHLDNNKVVWEDENWTMAHTQVSSIQSILEGLEGTNSSEWQHVCFFMPYWGWRNKEIVSAGIYYQDKLHIMFCNPTLEKGEEQSIRIFTGAKTYDLTLVGHEFYSAVLDCNMGMNVKDFILESTNIEGVRFKVSGLVSNILSDHYL